MLDIPVANAIAGGLLMGTGAGFLLFGNGRVAGIGGALGTALRGDFGEERWRVTYLLGIVLGGLLAHAIYPEYFDVALLDRPLALVVASGFVMGFGGRLCNGCTSGHGVCGVARLSVRSFVATATFFGIALVGIYLCRHVLEVF